MSREVNVDIFSKYKERSYQPRPHTKLSTDRPMSTQIDFFHRPGPGGLTDSHSVSPTQEPHLD